MVEKSEFANPEQQRQRLFVNGYYGNGASYEDSLIFNSAKLEKFLHTIGSKKKVYLVPMPLDGISVKQKPKFTIDNKFMEGGVVIRINGRRILQEIMDQEIKDPEKIKALFIREFNRTVGGALIDYGGGMNVFAATKSLFSWPFLFLGENLVKEKVDPKP